MPTHHHDADAIPKSLILAWSLVAIVGVVCLGLALAFGSYWLKPTARTVGPATSLPEIESPAHGATNATSTKI